METKISQAEVRRTLTRMKSGKTVGPDDIPVEVWKCRGDVLTWRFNKISGSYELGS